MVRSAKRVLIMAAALLLVAVTLFQGIAQVVHAEGTYQMNDLQVLEGRTAIYVDVLSAGETINISLSSDTFIYIYDIAGTPSDLDDDEEVANAEFTANLDPGLSLPSPVTSGVYKFTPESTGTYRIDLGDTDFERYDITVTPNNSTNPVPGSNTGRVWSYLWYFYADDVDSEDGYPEESSTDADLYALVPAPADGESFVWKLDLNNFAGGSYRLMANNIGLDAPYSGVSADQDDSSVTPVYPIYLGFPAIAGDNNSTTPTITAQTFEADNFNKQGTFEFNSNADNATYAITIDTNKDGIYGTGDRLLLGEAHAGLNSVEWDGKYANGETVTNGTYNARIQLRIGEFHFVARDVEASGGTHDGGETWANGLTIYKAIDADTTQNTTVYWDDVTALRQEVDDGVFELYNDATSNLPSGVTSGSIADANSDGKPDGFHTWGDFNSDSMGDGNFIDTFTYGGSDSKVLSIGVTWNGDTDLDGVSNTVENAAPNGGDGNDDGTPDSQQQEVTSLVNPATGQYTTIAITGCETLSSVSIFTEGSLQNKDGAFDYPVGLVNFDAICTTPGSEAEVTIYYDKEYDTTDWTGRKLLNGLYSNIPDVTFGTALVGGSTVTTMAYTLTDGGPLDEDGEVNGTIVDPAGPGIVQVAADLTVGAPNTGIAATYAKDVVYAAANVITTIVASLFIIAGVLYVYRRHEARKN